VARGTAAGPSRTAPVRDCFEDVWAIARSNRVATLPKRPSCSVCQVVTNCDGDWVSLHTDLDQVEVPCHRTLRHQADWQRR
jgi:hypothetical protein